MISKIYNIGKIISWDTDCDEIHINDSSQVEILIENDSIVLGFSHPSHRERMEHELTIPESRKTLSDAFTKIMNK